MKEITRYAIIYLSIAALVIISAYIIIFVSQEVYYFGPGVHDPLKIILSTGIDQKNVTISDHCAVDVIWNVQYSRGTFQENIILPRLIVHCLDASNSEILSINENFRLLVDELKRGLLQNDETI